MDDILCVWTGNEPEIHSFLQKLNDSDPAINFTLEIGENVNTYLDFHTELAQLDNILTRSFRIHREDTFTGVFIHSHSLPFGTHKFAAFNAAIHRITTIHSSPEAEDEEVLFIPKIAEVNGLTANVNS